jgi:hypothetical protein
MGIAQWQSRAAVRLRLSPETQMTLQGGIPRFVGALASLPDETSHMRPNLSPASTPG